jgi:hypothetical protein
MVGCFEAPTIGAKMLWMAAMVGSGAKHEIARSSPLAEARVERPKPGDKIVVAPESPVLRIEVLFNLARVHRLERLSFLRPEVPQLKEVANQLAGGLSYDDRVRLGDGLEPCSKIRRLADDIMLLRLYRRAPQAMRAK